MVRAKRQVSIGYHVRWIVGFTLIVLSSSLALVWWLKRLLDHTLDTGFSQTFYALKNFQKILLPAIGFSVVLYVILVSFIVLLLAVFTSHRIAGPLFRLEKIVAALKCGELNFSSQLRKGDQISGLAAGLGSIRESLVSELQPLGPALQRIEDQWRSLDLASREERTAEAVEALALIEAGLTALRTGLGR